MKSAASQILHWNTKRCSKERSPCASVAGASVRRPALAAIILCRMRRAEPGLKRGTPATCRPHPLSFVFGAWAQLASRQPSTQWPDGHDERRRYRYHDDGQRQAQLPVVAEPVAPGSHDECITLMPDWRQEVACGAHRDRHQIGIGIHAQRCRNRRCIEALRTFFRRRFPFVSGLLFLKSRTRL